jgi:hypothetical protein
MTERRRALRFNSLDEIMPEAEGVRAAIAHHATSPAP